MGEVIESARYMLCPNGPRPGKFEKLCVFVISWSWYDLNPEVFGKSFVTALPLFSSPCINFRSYKILMSAEMQVVD